MSYWKEVIENFFGNVLKPFSENFQRHVISENLLNSLQNLDFVLITNF